jgi:acyl-CoA synthetase (AMP-forming)/AMP-acid ligase II
MVTTFSNPPSASRAIRPDGDQRRECVPGRGRERHARLPRRHRGGCRRRAVADWGESPYAVVVLHPGAQVSPDELIGWTRDRLPHYKCPAGISFAPALARTASGKLQKQAIRSSLITSAVS